ncbi:hypothetical protein JCM12298_24480 [Desulfothermus naphthae]
MSKIGDIFKAVLGICRTKELSPHLWNLEQNKIYIDLEKVPELQKKDGAVYLKGKGLKYPVLIIRDGDKDFLAFVNRCTHIGHRKLDPVPEKKEIRCCSLFHSTFDYKGNKLRGPAKKPLTPFPVKCVNNTLIVDVGGQFIK